MARMLVDSRASAAGGEEGKLKTVGWTKGRELAKLAREQGQRFESAPWVHKAPEIAARGIQARGGEGADREGQRALGVNLL